MFRSARCVRLVLPFIFGAALLAAPTAASAATTASITGLSATGGYNSVRLIWTVPRDRAAYRGVTIWRYEGNRSDNPPRTLVATLGRSATSYLDANLTVPSTRLWAYAVYTRDATAGPVDPQYASDWMTSAVSGRVVDAAGSGLGGVLVNISSSPWTSGGGGGQTFTAADGTWFVDGISPGSTVACFDPRELSTGASTTGYLAECWDNVPSIPNYGRDSRAFTTTLGQLTPNVDATLDPGGAVTGVVHDRRGHLLANVGITVMRQDSQVRRQVVTGADGSYRVVGLAPGNYGGCGYQPYSNTVVITPASPYGYLTTCSDGSIGTNPQVRYAVAAGAVTQSDYVLADGGAVTGVLLGPDGAPVVGEYPDVDGPSAPDSRRTATDAQGRYHVTGLPAGRYTVCFDGSASEGTGVDFDPGRAPRCWKGADPGSATPVSVALGAVTSGVSVRQFANPTIEGRVVDAEGRPIARVSVGGSGGGGFTDSDGRYRFGVPPGTHTVCFYATSARGASASGYLDQCWQNQPGTSTPTPVSVRGGQQVTGIDATLATAAGARVSVADRRGTPLTGAYVTVSSPTGSTVNARTNARGVAVLTRMTPGADYTATVDPSAFGISPPGDYRRSVSSPVRLGPGTTPIKVTVATNGVLTGRVTDGTGAPVVGAYLEVVGAGYVPSYSTDDDGNYRIPSVTPGTYTVCVSDWVGSGPDSRYVTSCWDGASTRDTAIPVEVGDGAEVSGIDLRLQ